MKLGTSTSVLSYHSLADTIDIVAKAGFDGIDIWCGRPHLYRNDFDQTELRELKARLDDHGLHVASVMPAFYRYPHSLSNPNPRVRSDSLDYMKACIEHAVFFKADHVLVVPDHSLIGYATADSMARFSDSVAQLTEYIQGSPARLGIEVLYFDETDYMTSNQIAVDLIESLGSEQVGVVVDTGTLNLAAEAPATMLKTLGKHLFQLHLNDNHGQESQENLIPGDGTFDFVALREALEEAGYQGFCSLEISREFALSAPEALAKCLERLKGFGY